MRERFLQQLQDNKRVTEESLAMMGNKTYHNGDAVIIGDKILFGMTIHEDEYKNRVLTMIMLCEDQIDLYEMDATYKGWVETKVPIIKLK